MVKDTLVIPKGGIAWGTVTEAQAKRRMARGGKLDVNIDTIRLTDGEKVPLRAVKDVKGGGHTGAMTGAMVGTAIVFFPAAPLFLFMHGKDITIPKGTEITAYISGDTRLDEAKFKTDKNEPAAASMGAVTITSALLDISSTPPGADIEVDGKFVGSTPSSITVAPRGSRHCGKEDRLFSLEQEGCSYLRPHQSLSRADCGIKITCITASFSLMRVAEVAGHFCAWARAPLQTSGGIMHKLCAVLFAFLGVNE